MSEMKPCPFCGNEPTVTNEFDDEVLFYGCTKDIDCPLYDAPFVNLENWNNRPIEDALHARIAELEAERRWRVVADGELPELGKEVIFYDSIMERRLKGCLRKNGGVEWLSDEGYTFSSRDGRYSRITHWMYAPQPPEVKE